MYFNVLTTFSSQHYTKIYSKYSCVDVSIILIFDYPSCNRVPSVKITVNWLTSA